jgi:hypothetical protein
VSGGALVPFVMLGVGVLLTLGLLAFFLFILRKRDDE